MLWIPVSATELGEQTDAPDATSAAAATDADAGDTDDGRDAGRDAVTYCHQMCTCLLATVIDGKNPSRYQGCTFTTIFTTFTTLSHIYHHIEHHILRVCQ